MIDATVAAVVGAAFGFISGAIFGIVLTALVAMAGRDEYDNR